jgi:hypothetical protein
MEAGAWPFLVGGVICLVKSDNERDLNLLNSTVHRVISGCVGLRFGVFGGCRSVVGGKDTS